MWFLNTLWCAYFFYFNSLNAVYSQPQFHWRNAGRNPTWEHRYKPTYFTNGVNYQWEYRPEPRYFGPRVNYQTRYNPAPAEMNYQTDTSARYFGGYDPNTVQSYQCGRQIRIRKLTDALSVGEEPSWDSESRSVYFVDGPQSTVHRYEIDTQRNYSAKIGDEDVLNIIPVKGANGVFLISYGDYLAILTWNGVSSKATFERLRQPDPSHPWPNFFVADTKVAPNGALFLYTGPVIGDNALSTAPRQQGRLFSIKNGKQKTLITNLDIGNGIGFSRDGEWFYHSDSLQNVTWKSYYDQLTNSLTYTKVLVNYTQKGIPSRVDSLTVDKDGYVWTAINGASRIIKVDPKSGDVACSIELPASGPTNLGFGECPNGSKGRLDCIYVTTASRNIDSPTRFDGALLLVEGTGSEGVLPNKLQLNEIITSYS